MKSKSLFPVIIALVVALSACNDKAPVQNEPEPEATVEEAGPKTAAPEEPSVIAVDWNALEAMIPKTAAGLPRTNQAEDRSGLGDLGFSHALGIYEKGDRRVEVQILDSGSKKLILSTVASWYSLDDVNEQSKTAMEKSVTIQGFPGIERMDKTEAAAEVSAVVKDRFIVMIVGHNVSLQELRKVMDGFDLKKLENLG